MKKIALKIFTKERRYFLFVLAAVIIVNGSEFFLDYFFGDKDGRLTSYRFHFFAIFFQLLLLFGALAHKLKSLVLINILNIGIIIFLIEIIFSFLFENPIDNPIECATGLDFIVSDSLLGDKPRPNSQGESIGISTKTGNTLFSVIYSTDSLSRRTYPRSSSKKERYALFFGGSFTFGWGLNDEETLPYFFDEINMVSNTYNYASNGYGPHQMLRLLESRDLSKDVLEKKGFAVFVYIADHCKRVAGFLKYSSSYGGNAPHYVLENGSLKLKGNFESGRKWKSAIYDFLFSFRFLRYFNFDYPFSIKDNHLKLTAKVIEKAFSNYQQQFGNDHFFLLIFPGESDRIVNFIDTNTIKVLNYSGLFGAWDYRIKKNIDRHPNAKANRIIAEQLERDLHKYFLPD